MTKLPRFVSRMIRAIIKPGKRAPFSPPYPYETAPVTPESSERRYGIEVERDIMVAMSDGVRLAVDLYRPDAEGAFPALLSTSTYPKWLQTSGSPRPDNEAGDTEFFVTRGYCHVIADCRGSGKSEGEFGLLNDREIEDGAELVEWIAGQEWCDGNVGMMGISYFGITQLLVAEKRPPHLKAIFPYDALEDMYRDLMYHGGKFCAGYMTVWMMLVLSANPRFLRGGKALEFARDVFLQRKKFDGPFYWERSAYPRLDRIEVPVYLGSGWHMVGMHLRGAFTGWEGIKAPKRMLIGGSGLQPRPWTAYREELLRWYDHWLKGMETGVMGGPPISIYVMGDERWRGEEEWPLARTGWRELYLHPGEGKKDGLLDSVMPEEDEGALRYFFSPVSVTGLMGAPRLVYRTAPLQEKVEVTGPIALTLYASSTARDTTWMVRLLDEDERGRCRKLTRGWLKASHREVDPERSRPYRPWHPHTRKEKLKRGKVYEFNIEIWPTSMAFKPGHRIRLEVSSTDSPIFDFPFFHLPDPRVGWNTVHHSDLHPSHLLLPIIDSEI